MWIGGLRALQKPFLHLHTQFNREAPWDRIDMDFMNLNQAAHGDREAGFMHTRLRLRRKVVVGHWSDAEVQERIGAWARVDAGLARSAGRQGRRASATTCARSPSPRATRCRRRSRSGSRSTATASAIWRRRCVTCQRRAVDDARARSTRAPTRWPRRSRRTAPSGRRCATARASSWACARSSTGGGFKGFTTTFEDLHGLVQLPGLARAAPDGRRLRVRRRGRLEDRRRCCGR